MGKLLEYTKSVAAKHNVSVQEYCGYTESWLSSYTVDNPKTNKEVESYFQ